MDAACEECGKVFTGPAGGRGNVAWRVASHRSKAHGTKAAPKITGTQPGQDPEEGEPRERIESPSRPTPKAPRRPSAPPPPRPPIAAVPPQEADEDQSLTERTRRVAGPSLAPKEVRVPRGGASVDQWNRFIGRALVFLTLFVGGILSGGRLPFLQGADWDFAEAMAMQPEEGEAIARPLAPRLAANKKINKGGLAQAIVEGDLWIDAGAALYDWGRRCSDAIAAKRRGEQAPPPPQPQPFHVVQPHPNAPTEGGASDGQTAAVNESNLAVLAGTSIFGAARPASD